MPTVIVIWNQEYEMSDIIAVVTPEKFAEVKIKYIKAFIDDVLHSSVSSQVSPAPYTVSDITEYDNGNSFGIRYWPEAQWITDEAKKRANARLKELYAKRKALQQTIDDYWAANPVA